ncbi:hypothetical protein A3K63_05205 [Candidatus Micrarchaeota archaeon RBG_16_49_10]|nr:MAG: hypothetical protein A3K63_05205 [Candidatus Micrarchaeota archaeon RBG_16_49_10]
MIAIYYRIWGPKGVKAEEIGLSGDVDLFKMRPFPDLERHYEQRNFVGLNIDGYADEFIAWAKMHGMLPAERMEGGLIVFSSRAGLIYTSGIAKNLYDNMIAKLEDGMSEQLRISDFLGES